jgi:hypothetical protein
VSVRSAKKVSRRNCNRLEVTVVENAKQGNMTPAPLAGTRQQCVGCVVSESHQVTSDKEVGVESSDAVIETGLPKDQGKLEDQTTALFQSGIEEAGQRILTQLKEEEEAKRGLAL